MAVGVHPHHVVLGRRFQALVLPRAIELLEVHDLLLVERGEILPGARSEVAAGTLDPEDGGLLAGQGVRLLQLRGGVAPPGVGDPLVGAEQIGAVDEPAHGIERTRLGVIPQVIDIAIGRHRRAKLHLRASSDQARLCLPSGLVPWARSSMPHPPRMIRINENYTKLKASYLFADIAKRVNAYVAAHPDQPVIRLGIGDVTEPLPPVCVEALHAASDEMSAASDVKGLRTRAGRLCLPARSRRPARLRRPRLQDRGGRDLHLRRREVRLRQHPGDLRR